MRAIKFATQVDGDVLKDLKIAAKQMDRSISRLVTEAIREYLQRIRIRPAFRSAMKDVLNDNEELLKRLAK